MDNISNLKQIILKSLDTNKALVPPTIINVKIQPIIAFITTVQFKPVHFVKFSNEATPIVPPIWQWVVDNGIPKRLPIIIIVADPNSIE